MLAATSHNYKTANIRTWILVVVHIVCECRECAALFPGLSVDSVGPLYGPVAGGTRVTITGQYLSKSTVKSVYIGQYELHPDTNRCVLLSYRTLHLSYNIIIN